MKKSPKARRVSTPLGIKDFTDMVSGSHFAWSLFAVRGEFQYVAYPFIKGTNTLDWTSDVSIEPKQGSEKVAKRTTIIQLADNPWTIVLRSVFYVSREEFFSVPQEAESASRTLKTKAISLIGEDTAGTLSYKLFDSGREQEFANWELGGPFTVFRSQLRKQPKLKAAGLDFADDLFRELGIYVPACYPCQKGRKNWLAVAECSASTVKKADVFELGTIATPTVDQVISRLIAKGNRLLKNKK